MTVKDGVRAAATVPRQHSRGMHKAPRFSPSEGGEGCLIVSEALVKASHGKRHHKLHFDHLHDTKCIICHQVS